MQLRGFPDWTEFLDLKFTIDQCGVPCISMRFVPVSPQVSMAEALLPNWEAAEAVVKQLHKFEFTPGYPLQARIKPGQQRTSAQQAPRPSETIDKLASHLAGARPSVVKQEKELPYNPETSPESCIGAGRIDGWFVSSKTAVFQKGWGHVQSFSFEGNLLFRPPNSPLLRDVEFKQKDPVYFEVRKVRGKCEAFRLRAPDQEAAEVVEESIATVPEYPSEPEEIDPSAPSLKSQKRREREEADGRCLFFGNLGNETTEDTLTRFAEQAGEVQKVKLFYNTTNWQSKGCGKVYYLEQEGADKALQELTGTVLNDRIVTVEPLGQNSSTKPKKPKPEPTREDFTDNMPKQLPLSIFGNNDDPNAKLQICYAQFESLLYNHDAEGTGVSLILMIRKLVMEVNDIFGDDEDSLMKWLAMLKSNFWFAENGQAVKWQANKKRVNIKKLSANAPIHIDNNAKKREAVEQRKLEQQMMGKPIFQA